MRNYILVLLCLECVYSVAQNSNDTDKIDIGITAYLFAYDTKFNTGSFVIGPTVFLNAQELAVQIGLLYDFTPYTYYVKVGLMQYEKVQAIHWYFPFVVHYRFYSRNKVSAVFTAGIFLESKTPMSGGSVALNFVGGGGISYNFLKILNIRTSPTLRYAQKKLYPGIQVDFSVSFKVRKNKNQ